MTFNGRTFLYVALGCGLALVPISGLMPSSPATLSAQSAQDQDVDPLKRPP